MTNPDIQDQVLDMFTAIVEDVEYQKKFRERAIAGVLPPEVEEYMFYCVLGNPPVFPAPPREKKTKTELRVLRSKGELS